MNSNAELIKRIKIIENIIRQNHIISEDENKEITLKDIQIIVIKLEKLITQIDQHHLMLHENRKLQLKTRKLTAREEDEYRENRYMTRYLSQMIKCSKSYLSNNIPNLKVRNIIKDDEGL